jgi:hypothetical protein
MTDTIAPRALEQRLVLRVLSYWRELAGTRPMPTVYDVGNPTVGDIREDCFVLEFVESGELVFRSVGARQQAVLGSDPAGLPVSALDEETLLGRAVSYHGHVLERKAPISVGGQFIDVDGRTILYRSILLPLGKNAVTALLGCVNSRVVVLE